MKNLLFVLFAVMAISCSPLKVTYDLDKDADFSNIKTYSFYGWAKNSELNINELNQKRIEDAFANELKKRGLQFVEEGGDIVVSLFVMVDTKTSVRAYTDHYHMGGYSYSPWGWGYGYSRTRYQEYDYEVGTLICDVFQSSTKKLIWQGVASSTLDDKKRNEERNIQYAVAQIMKKFPVRPVK